MAGTKKPTSVVSDPKPEAMAFSRALRVKGNAMTDIKREDSFNHGMNLIYGSSGRIAGIRG